MFARISTVAAATAAGLLVFGSPASATLPDCHGTALTDPAGDQYILLTTPGPRLAPTAAIDIVSAYLTGSAGAEKLNIRVSDLAAPSQNTSYTFRWNDAGSPLGGVYWELQATFPGVDASGAGIYTLWRNTSAGSTIWGTSGRTFIANDVVQIDLRHDVTSWPATLRGIQATASQDEAYFWEPGFPPVSVGTVRFDNASAPDWTQPC